MDATTSTTVWWACPDCGVDAELPDGDSIGAAVPCPDCPAQMAELWSWDTLSDAAVPRRLAA